MGLMGSSGRGRMDRPVSNTLDEAIEAARADGRDRGASAELDACIAAVAALATPEGKLPPVETVIRALEARRPPGPRGALNA